MRVVVVDDDAGLAELLGRVFIAEGFTVEVANCGQDAITTAHRFRPDAVILDIGLPDLDGLTVLQRLRADNPRVCVVFLTARDSVEDRIAGITAGGDDYLTKPFSLEELQARLRGVLRQAGMATPAQSKNLLQIGDLTLDEDSHEVHRGNDPVQLTATEFELLRYLMRNPSRVLSKTQILSHVWQYDFGGDAHVVELYISYLRKKIDRDRPPMIRTVRGVGYQIRAAG